MRSVFSWRARRLRTLAWLLAALTLMAFGPINLGPDESGALFSPVDQAGLPEASEELGVAQEVLSYISRSWWWDVPLESPRLRSRVYVFSLRSREPSADILQARVWTYEQEGQLHLELDFKPSGGLIPQIEGEIAPGKLGIRLPGVRLTTPPQTRPVGRHGLVRFHLQPHPHQPHSVRLVLITTPAARVAWPAEGDLRWRLSFWRDAEAVAAYHVRSAETGLASWYGKAFAGRRTASGERFDPKALTAAHRHLPLGTQVRVVNLQNGRSTMLRINDRGPYAGRRIIDVSRGAAERLGFRSQGVAKVRVEVLERRQPAMPREPDR